MERNNQIITHVGFHKTSSTFIKNKMKFIVTTITLLVMSLSYAQSDNEIFISFDTSPFKMDTIGLYGLIKKRGLQNNYNDAANALLANTCANFYNNVTNNPFILKSLHKNNLPEPPLYFFLSPLEHNSAEVMGIYNKAIGKKVRFTLNQ